MIAVSTRENVIMWLLWRVAIINVFCTRVYARKTSFAGLFSISSIFLCADFWERDWEMLRQMSLRRY